MWFIRRRLAIAASLVAMLGLAGPTLGGIAVCCEGRHLADTGELPPCCEGDGHMCPMHATSPVADGPRVDAQCGCSRHGGGLILLLSVLGVPLAVPAAQRPPAMPRVELPRIAAILQSAHTPLSPPPRG